MAQTSMGRAEAASLLGVPADADPRQVRRAFRLWVAVAHPDRGGCADGLDRLREARDVLLRAEAAPPDDHVESGSSRPAARTAWRDVLARRGPRERALEATAVVAAVAVAAVPGFPAAQAAASAVLAAIAAWTIARLRLAPVADSGQRVIVATAAWLAVVIAQLAVSTVAGASLLPVLPLLAVPLVATVSLVLMPRGGLALRR